ncbi:MAG: esterase/lipase family protein [Acidobacteriota bacterium]
MRERVFLIHGWSVQETTTYQALHEKLAEHGFDLRAIHLGRHVSLENDIEIRDIARALHRALQAELATDWASPFHIVTHSTGALVAKQWIARHYSGRFAARKPLRNIVFLAGPHFGSRLAHHGLSMLAQARYRGETGRKVLGALELGSSFAWRINEAWLDPATWRRKGIRPFNLIGDRVERKFFESKIFPGAYEAGSDMVVRVASGNLDFKRFTLSPGRRGLKLVGAIRDIPFAALSDYTHSGAGHGIMNSITSRSTRANHLGLRLILDCLRVRTRADHDRMRGELAAHTRRTRRRRPGYAQMDFRFLDEDGRPVEDYVVKLGAIVRGRRRPSRAVVHCHKNRSDPNHFTAFIRMRDLEPRYDYFLEFECASACDLVAYRPDPLVIEAPERRITEIISQDQTTQFDIVLSREPSRKLFVFHRGDDPDLHVRWNRKGEIVKTGLSHK